MVQKQDLPDFVAPKVAAEIESWLRHLGAERRMSPKTVEAYRRDVLQFLEFLAEHLGGAPSLQDLAALAPADVRAFMAARRSSGIGSRSLMRMLAGTRAFARFLERNGKGKVGALAAVRAPKVGKTLPRPLTAANAKQTADPGMAAGDGREPWIHARDAAVLALLYGSGLRISEALGLKRADFSSDNAITVIGKGRKQRMVPVLPQVQKLIDAYVALCPYDLPIRRPTVRRRQGRPAVATNRAARHGAAARRARLAGNSHATCLAALVCDAPVVARRRHPLDPGTARPRLTGDDADLYGSRCRTADRGVSQRSSAGLIEICRHRC